MLYSQLLYTVYISFVFMGLRYGTGRHHDDLNKQDISRAVRVSVAAFLHASLH